MKQLSLEEIKQIGKMSMNFVVGKERSGTTLLQVMLNTHPNIIAPPESRFIILFYYRYGKVKKWTERILKKFCDDLYREKSFKNFWGVDKKTLLDSFITAKDIATYPLLCKIVFYHASPDKDVKMFFDKNPIYCYFLPELKKLFPEARYIHIVRDYRATIVSHRRIFVVKQSADLAYRWMKMNMQIEKNIKNVSGGYLTLRYEDLVSEPFIWMEAICDFLGIAVYEKMANEHSSGIYSTYNSNIETLFRKLHRKVFNPISASGLHEWEKELSQEDILTAERIAGEYGNRVYGYNKVSNGAVLNRSQYNTLVMKVRYHTIANLYIIALRNPWLYFKVQRFIVYPIAWKV